MSKLNKFKRGSCVMCGKQTTHKSELIHVDKFIQKQWEWMFCCINCEIKIPEGQLDD